MSGEFPSDPTPETGGFEDGFVGFTPDMLAGLALMAAQSDHGNANDLLLMRVEGTLVERLKHLDEDDPEHASYERAREDVRVLTDEMLNKEFFGRSALEN
jgi:hypothetical protein